MPVIFFFFFLERLASESESSREAEEKEGEMGKANTPPAQASWEWAQAAPPLSPPTLETHSIGVGRCPGGLLCKRWGGGRHRFLLPRPLQPQKPPSPRCVRNCLEARASCRCPALMNHTLSGLGVPNGRGDHRAAWRALPRRAPASPPHHPSQARVKQALITLFERHFKASSKYYKKCL